MTQALVGTGVFLAATTMTHAIAVAGGLVAAGLALLGGAICAGVGDGLAGAATITGTARQPEAQGRLSTIMFLIIGLAEGMYFINFALAILFVFVIAPGVQ
jgi:F-type H+-transporting ATPase subunit c